MQRIYLDYAATTPVDERVLRAMEPFHATHFGNPSSLHLWGQEASRAVYGARRVIASYIGALPKEIIFTSGATEANNLILQQIVLEAKKRGVKHPKIIVSSIEHESVLETAKNLALFGVSVVCLKVSRTGLLDLEHLKKVLDTDTVLVSVMYANNEVGTIEPIAEISSIIKNFKAHAKNVSYPFFHTDASQALQFLNCDVTTVGVDAMTLSSHKIYGPKGVGALYLRKAKQDLLSSFITGGGQEENFRSGTENVPGIVGFAEAVALLKKEQSRDIERISRLRVKLFRGIETIYKKARLNTPKNALPNNLNVYFPNMKAHDLVIALDMLGVGVSAGSACALRTSEPSHVLRAMGYPKSRLTESIRFSLGRPTTAKEIIETVGRIKTVIKRGV